MQSSEAPLAGVRVVEVALGPGVVAAGPAGSLPGAWLRDLGAEVTRVRPRRRSTLDAGVRFERAWDHGKRVVELDDDPEAAVRVITGLAAAADVLVVSGGEEVLERRGVRYSALAQANPRLVVARIRPAFHALGEIADIELLVQARAGLLTQIRSHRGGPAFGDPAVAGLGAALSATVGVLALLYEREATGAGGWAETSLYDGLQAILPMISGTVEHHSPSTRLLWEQQGPAEALSYRCADGEYLQLWFGAKGAYEQFLAHIGDPPSEQGYNADLISGAMVERGKRWAATFATRDRDQWLESLAGQQFRCEPVWRPGEALRDGHVREIGLAVDRDDPELGPVTMLGPVLRVQPAGAGAPRPGAAGTRLLSDVRVLDLSAYLAGPVAPLILAELGADVVKVEPRTGDAHRAMQPMFAAGQRGKRALALDLKAPGAAEVLRRLFRDSDVVHHNSRVGAAGRLGYDEAAVRAANPAAVYSFASGFGEQGPRALLPANDQLMQALAGIEAGQGGHGQPPTYLVWGAIDVTGGWLAAIGIVAGLYARRRHGGGQVVRSSLLGAALTMKSGAFLAGDRVLGGPVLDAGQTGYGAAYRLYRGGDQSWFALAIPDRAAWDGLRATVSGADLPADPPPLRTDSGDRQPEELVLEQAFATKDAAWWVAALRAAGVPVEPVPEADRTAFTTGFVDDPVNRRLGRVTTYRWGDLGRVAQPCFPPRLGPAPQPRARAGIPGLGEHTRDVLRESGFGDAEIEELIGNGTVAAPASGSAPQA
ncbi:CoA transferase [Nocardia sp. alder85J]|uniref:CoA transferase n=1 Tax=Nocardia sp. alder85J TaxID=2862949 RepID=UPI001CD6CE22|nr:CoA transferase [Nocardia sp. alder85J]MCX4092909.1 CoA transferase [Nocardia sp. alder85J]